MSGGLKKKKSNNEEKITIGLILFGLLTSITLLATHHFLKEETLAPQEVSKKWGRKALVIKQFKVGNEQTRSEMAYALLASKNTFKGKTVTEIHTLFGKPDGFYFLDIFPAYLIQTANTFQEEAWQIVFILNNQRKVKDIIVHKNCCK